MRLKSPSTSRVRTADTSNYTVIQTNMSSPYSWGRRGPEWSPWSVRYTSKRLQIATRDCSYRLWVCDGCGFVGTRPRIVARNCRGECPGESVCAMKVVGDIDISLHIG